MGVSFVRIGIVGAGYVSDFYASTASLHPGLKITAVMDKIPERADALASRLGARSVSSVESLLAEVDLVVNLTNPGSHFEINAAALADGKHVYTEKPLATSLDQAAELGRLAARSGAHLSSAPCNLLGETAQTMWRLLRSEAVGTVRLVYAEMDDGMLHRMNFRSWVNTMGIPWPYRDEIAVGCTAEHAGYYLTWLVAFFGQATAVTAFSGTQVMDKVPGELLDNVAPDITVGCVEFASGVVARLTCSVLAPHDHSLRIIGDDGLLETKDCWNYRSPVTSRRWMNVRRKTFLGPPRRHKLASSGYTKPTTGSVATMDYWRGVLDLIDAVEHGRGPRLGTDVALHVNELTLALDTGGFGQGRYETTTTMCPIEPMPWAN